MTENQDFRVGDWVICPSRLSVGHGEDAVRVKPKAMAVLEVLAAADGQVVTRDQLFAAVWRGGAVSDDALTQCIVELRKAFGDTARDARVIETIPRRGFRLVPPVSALEAAADRAQQHPALLSRPAGSRRAMLALGGVLLLAMVLAALRWLQVDVDPVAEAGSAATTTLAVLPFVDVSPAADQEWFADGLSEELIVRLSQLDGLLVTGRSSSFRFEDSGDDLRSIGEALNVRHILEGSVRRVENELRVSAQLVDVNNGFTLWSDQYERALEDVFEIQQEIAENVATALSVRLSVGELGHLEGGTDNLDAFDQVMLGHSSLHKRTTASYLQAIRHYRRATLIDPNYALAYAYLANAHRDAWLTLGSREREFHQQLAEQALDEALRLAPASPHVVASAAFMYLDQLRWADAERTLAQVIALDQSIEPKNYRIELLIKVGRAAEAVAPLEAARRQDPLGYSGWVYLAHLYSMQGRTEEALEILEQGYAAGRGLPSIVIEGMIAAFGLDDPARIERWLDRAVEYELPGALGTHTAMASLYHDEDAALRWLRDAYDESDDLDFYIAVFASYFGDLELALNAMRRSPDAWAFWLPVTAEVRRTPGFKSLVRDIGLVEYWQEFGWSDFCRPVGTEDFECS